MSFKQFFKEYFTMNRIQQCGSIVLVCLIIITLVLPRVAFYFKERRDRPNFELFEEIMSNYVELGDDEPMKHEVYIDDTVFTFNPNEATFDDFVCLGLSERIANNIVKYRKSGGKFKTPDDFAKIYGITDSMYAKLRPYISIPQQLAEQKHKKKNSTNKSYTYNNKYERKRDKDNVALSIVELNTADSAQLDALRGIGPVLAKRIVAYRDMLGGYYSVEQLREINNLSDKTYADLYIQFEVDTTKIRKIDINNFKYKQLSSHPYLPLAQLNSIMNYKRLMGKFSTVDDLLKYKLVDSVTFEKLSPYLEAK